MSPYGPTILDHFRNPRNYGDLDPADVTREVFNPVCGDRVRLMLRLERGRITAARFKGDCCAIGRAAASLLTGMLRGRRIADAERLTDDKLLAALDARIQPARLRCALLPLVALREGLAERRARADGRERIAAVILAAGRSSRFGTNKLLAPLGGAPVVRRATENVLSAGVDDLVVVLGRDADAVRHALEDLPVRFVVNARYAEGMSTSLRAGIAALPADAGGTLIVLGDQPSVDPGIIRAIITAYRDSERAIVAPVYDGVRGNPVLFGAAILPELRRVRGDQGAREVIARDPGRVETVVFAFPPPPDIDTPEDHQAALRRLRSG